MMKTWGETDQGFLVRALGSYFDLVEFHITVVANDQLEELYALPSKLLKLFVLPTELPLVREVDHSINIVEGAHVVNVRKYHYTHH